VAFEERLYTAIGQRIRQYRQQRGLKQADLAEAPNVNLTRTSISNIEKGLQGVQLPTLYAIAQVLEVAVFNLLPDSDEIYKDKSVDHLIADRQLLDLEGKPHELDREERHLLAQLLSPRK
jgi:transcriptional regulator with XRE-family HTH domain